MTKLTEIPEEDIKLLDEVKLLDDLQIETSSTALRCAYSIGAAAGLKEAMKVMEGQLK